MHEHGFFEDFKRAARFYERYVGPVRGHPDEVDNYWVPCPLCGVPGNPLALKLSEGTWHCRACRRAGGPRMFHKAWIRRRWHQPRRGICYRRSPCPTDAGSANNRIDPCMEENRCHTC